jgi:hypothetical protein
VQAPQPCERQDAHVQTTNESGLQCKSPVPVGSMHALDLAPARRTLGVLLRIRWNNRRLKTARENIEHLISDTTGRGPRDMKAAGKRPNPDSAFLPSGMRTKRGQGKPTPLYVLPSGREKLKGKVPDHVGECKPLNSEEWRSWRSVLKVPDIRSRVKKGSTAKRSDPSLCVAGNSKRTSKSLSRRPGKKWLTLTVRSVHDNGFEKRIRGEQNETIRQNGKRRSFKNAASKSSA